MTGAQLGPQAKTLDPTIPMMQLNGILTHFLPKCLFFCKSKHHFSAFISSHMPKLWYFFYTHYTIAQIGKVKPWGGVVAIFMWALWTYQVVKKLHTHLCLGANVLPLEKH